MSVSHAAARPLLAVIPARGGSKGLPGKNIRPLLGLPLIAHSIACARMTPEVDRVVVSTDSADIANVAIAHGGEAPFLRPADLAHDTASVIPALRHALLEMEARDGRRYETLLLMDPTSPTRYPEDIRAALAMLDADPACDGVIAVSQPEFNPYWHCVVEREGYMRDLIDGAALYDRRQDVPAAYRITGLLYLWRRDYLLSCANWREGRLQMLVLPESRSFSIDDRETFDRLEVLVREGLIPLPWLT